MAIKLSEEKLVIAQLRNVYCECDVIIELKNYFFYGLDDLKKELKMPGMRWVRNYLYGYNGNTGLIIRYQNMYYAWPKYPTLKSLNNPIGDSYEKRIKYTFSELQEVVNLFYFLIKKVFDNLIFDDEWYVRIEKGINLICSAYEDEIHDQFGARKGCIIVRPNDSILRDIQDDAKKFKEK